MLLPGGPGPIVRCKLSGGPEGPARPASSGTELPCDGAPEAPGEGAGTAPLSRPVLAPSPLPSQGPGVIFSASLRWEELQLAPPSCDRDWRAGAFLVTWFTFPGGRGPHLPMCLATHFIVDGDVSTPSSPW